MPVNRLSDGQKARILLSLGVILVFLLAQYGGRMIYGWFNLAIDNPYWRTLYTYSWWVIPVLLSLRLFFPSKSLLSLLGLNRNGMAGLVFALLSTLPMLISSAFLGEINPELDLFRLIRGTVLAGFMEEFLYRGFLFGILFGMLKWKFIPAALIGAVIFGMNHLYQSSDPMASLGIFLVTFLGAGWFSWLYVEWQRNLWVPIFLHFFMNLSWALFEINENALGDWVPNVFRIMTIAVTVIYTLYRAGKRGFFEVNRSNLI
jgi:membrane protease YdiL (CAAX protease family)